MEFAIPWENWNVKEVQYGLAQTNTRIDNGLFVPIFYSNQLIRCQAFHLLSPILVMNDDIENKQTGTFIVVRIPKDSEFAKKVKELDAQNLQEAVKNKNIWWSTASKHTYHSSLRNHSSGDLEWQIQVPDSGIFTCFDCTRKKWFASNESGLTRRKWRILVRTSGLWIDQHGFGMDWKLIGAFVE